MKIRSVLGPFILNELSRVAVADRSRGVRVLLPKRCSRAKSPPWLRAITYMTDEITNRVCSRAALARVCRRLEGTRAEARDYILDCDSLRFLSVSYFDPLERLGNSLLRPGAT